MYPYHRTKRIEQNENLFEHSKVENLNLCYTLRLNRKKLTKSISFYYFNVWK